MCSMSIFHISTTIPTQLSYWKGQTRQLDATVYYYYMLHLILESAWWGVLESILAPPQQLVWLRRLISLPIYLRFQTLTYLHALFVSKLKLELRILFNWSDSFKYLKSLYVRRRVDCNEMFVESHSNVLML